MQLEAAKIPLEEASKLIELNIQKATLAVNAAEKIAQTGLQVQLDSITTQLQGAQLPIQMNADMIELALKGAELPMQVAQQLAQTGLDASIQALGVQLEAAKIPLDQASKLIEMQLQSATQQAEMSQQAAGTTLQAGIGQQELAIQQSQFEKNYLLQQQELAITKAKTDNPNLQIFGDTTNGYYSFNPATGEKQQLTGGGGNNQNIDNLSQAVISNPSLYYTLSASMRNSVLANLQSKGFDATTLVSPALIGKSAAAVAAFNQADGLLNQIEKLFTPVITAQNAYEAAGQRISSNVEAFIKTNPAAAVYKDSLTSYVSLIARAAGEKGVLTDKDIERFTRALPAFGDTQEIAQMKMESLRGLFDAAKQGTLSAYSGDSSLSTNQPTDLSTGQSNAQEQNSWISSSGNQYNLPY